MAMQVAMDCGVPDHIVGEASKLHQELASLGRSGFVSGQHIVKAANRAGFLTESQAQGQEYTDAGRYS